MEKVFRLLGTRQCEYYRGADGKWLIKTVYKTKKGEFVIVQADAATGIVIRVITSGI